MTNFLNNLKNVRWLHRNQQELNLQQRKAAIEQRLVESGEKERLLEYLRQKLIESGWKDELKNYCKGKRYAELIRNKGLDRITVADLVEELKPRARATVPPKAKEELLARIKNFIENNP